MKIKSYLLLLSLLMVTSCSKTNNIKFDIINYSNVENKDIFFEKQNAAITNCVFFKESVSAECNINFKRESLTNTYLNDELVQYVSNNCDVDYFCCYDKTSDLSYLKSKTTDNSVREDKEDSTKFYVSNNNYEEKVFQIGIYGDKNKEYLLSFNLLDNTYYEIEEKSDNIVSSYVFTYALSLYNSLFDKYSSEFKLDDDKNVYFVDENVYTIKFETSKFENVTYDDNVVGYKDCSEYAVVQYVAKDDKLQINCYIEENEVTNYSKTTNRYISGNKVTTTSKLSLTCEFDLSNKKINKQDINNYKYRK